MCINCGCEGVTYPNGSDGIGITSITDNGDGTFTILMSDGSSFISPNYEGPQGIQGAQGIQGDPGPQGDPGTNGTNGINGTTLLYTLTQKQFSVDDPDVSMLIPTSNLAINGDTLRLIFTYHVNDSTAGVFNITNIPSNGLPGQETILSLVVAKESTGLIQIVLTKEGTNLKGYATTSSNDLTIDILIENFFTGANSVFNIESDFTVGDAWVNNVTLELLKMID
jgi:hypothetical protein